MHPDTHSALVRLFWTWLLVGVSQMTPLQFVQFVAAITATVYTVLQTVVLLSERWRRWRNPTEGGRP